MVRILYIHKDELAADIKTLEEMGYIEKAYAV